MRMNLACGVSIIAIGMSFFVAPAVLQAQTQDAPPTALPEQPAAKVDPQTADIVVTGSRLRTAVAAPTPVTLASSDQLKAAAPGLLATGLTQLPVFKGSSLPSTSTQSPSRDNGAAFLNLRGLGKEKTLVLLDGRRMVSSSTGGVPDVNLIPQNLVSRVEIVTGGASAAYGSDAVAGVVNFILDTKFTGVRGNVSSGISTYGDGRTLNAGVTGGTAFANGAGHVVMSAEYFNQKAIGYDTGRDAVESFAGIASVGGGVRAVVENQGFSIPTGGRISALAAGSPLSSSVVNLMFLDGGAVRPYSFGNFADGARQVGGDGTSLPFNLTADVERYNVFGRAQYELGSGLTIYAEGTFARSRTRGDFQWPQVGALGYQYTIYSDNAFLRQLPAATQATLGLPAAGGPSVALFALKRIPADNGLVYSITQSETIRAVGGADWDLGGGFEINAYYMHGENTYKNEIKNNPNQLRRYAAVDAVVDPSSGKTVCRVTLTNPTLFPGCVPYNPFGPNPGNEASQAYINGVSTQDLTLKQDVASLAVRGSPFALPAGDVNIAAGVEYRREAAVQTDDAVTVRPFFATDADVAAVRSFPVQLLNVPTAAYHYTNSLPLSGGYNVKEVFAEINIPLLKEQPLANLLGVSGAIRYIDYSTVGGVTTWKLGATYEPIKGVRFRATRSRDIRAGTIGELYSGQIQATGTVNYQGSVQPVFGVRSGNPALTPEKADTLTVGMVLQPGFVPGFSFTVDYYDIKISDAIQQLTSQRTIDACNTGSAAACAQISRNDAGTLVIGLPFLNLAEVTNSGVDFEANYTTQAGAGRFGARVVVSYLDKFDTIVPGAAIERRAGDIGLTGTPKWTGNLILTYDTDRFGVFAQERFIGGGKVDNTLTNAQLLGNDVGSTFYTDLTVHYNVDPDRSNFELFATVNNVLNQQPKIAPAVPLGNYRPTNAALYDTIGRYFTVGARVKF